VRDTRREENLVTARISLLMGLALLLCSASLTVSCAEAEPPATQGETVTPSQPEAVSPPAESPGGTAAQQPSNDLVPQVEEAADSPCPGGSISPEAAWDLLQSAGSDVTMIDIRYESEYEEEHVPGSIHIGVMDDDFMARLRELPRDGTYLIICWHGRTSPGTVYNMKKEGFTKVCSVDGGYEGWRSRGLPLES
jgi:rhodanese-related sulfurtransferase